jgi:hypothetical protein
MLYLKDWAVTYTTRNQRPCLRGVVVNHPEFPDAAYVYTSPIVTIDGRVVTTSNNTYLLDGPSDTPLAGVVPKPVKKETVIAYKLVGQ